VNERRRGLGRRHDDELADVDAGGAIPAAAARGMGVMIIKSIRPRETVKELAAEDMKRIGVKLEPFYAGNRLPWMRPDYREC
jgi:hypothetical protein